jgi:hypothetical protein
LEVAALELDKNSPARQRQAHPERTVLAGTLARRFLPNQQDTLREGTKQSGLTDHVGGLAPEGGAAILTKKKRKSMLDMANKKRNTILAFEVGYVSGSILFG